MSLHPRPLSAWATFLPRAQHTDLESRARITEQLTSEVVKRKCSKVLPPALCLAGFNLNDLDVDRCPSELKTWVPSSLQRARPVDKVFAVSYSRSWSPPAEHSSLVEPCSWIW